MKLLPSFAKKKEPLRQPRGAGADAGGYVFRRSRTLTGTTSPKVTASNEARSQLKTERLKAHELHQLRKRIVRILAVVLVLIGILGYFVASYARTIVIEYSQAGLSANKQTYAAAVEEYFARHPLERFGFALNRKQFAQELAVTRPELKSIDVDRNWYGGSRAFVFGFRKPILRWDSGGKTFYVDGQGVAFGYDYFGGKYVKVSDQSGISPTDNGGEIASNRLIAFLGKMVGAVDAGDKGKVTDIIIPASTREIDLKLEGRGYIVKTHTDRDPLGQAQDIIATIKWLDDKKIKPEYIDVRVPGKAFYK